MGWSQVVRFVREEAKVENWKVLRTPLRDVKGLLGMNVSHPGGRAVLSSGDEGILDTAAITKGLGEFRVGGKVLGLVVHVRAVSSVRS